MKQIVVYSGKTGFTQKYAQWIAQELSCEAVDFKSWKPDGNLADVQVIYGGSIFAGRVQDLDKLQKMNVKPSIVFAVGLTEPSAEYDKQLQSANAVGSTPLFYLRGGACYEKLGFMSRMMLKKISGFKENVDFSDKRSIEPLIACAKKE